jgi:hypothetical protein
MFTSDDDTLKFFLVITGAIATDIWIDVFSGLEQ